MAPHWQRTPRGGICFARAGSLIVELARRWYTRDDESVLPRSIASRPAFENAMALDMAMGGSTNTVLHILAAAQEGEVDFNLTDIDAISHRVPCLCKVAPNSDYHMEDVHRAGRIPAILGELHRTGLLNTDVKSVHSATLDEWLSTWIYVVIRRPLELLSCFAPHPVEFAPRRLSPPRTNGPLWTPMQPPGCIRDVEHAYTADGGLAVLRGNLAEDGAVIKTAGIDAELWRFSGPAGPRWRPANDRGSRGIDSARSAPHCRPTPA